MCSGVSVCSGISMNSRWSAAFYTDPLSTTHQEPVWENIHEISRELCFYSNYLTNMAAYIKKPSATVLYIFWPTV